MKIGLKAAIVLAGILAAVTQPASGQITFDGVCTMNATFTFNAPITLNSPARTWSMTGGGTCVTDAEPLSPIKSMFLNGSGTSQLSQCGAMRLLGFYGALFGPSPAPPASNGALELIGTAAGGILHISAPSPKFEGVATVASGGAIGCANGGTTQLTFNGALVFTDP